MRLTVETRNLCVGFDPAPLLSGALTPAEAFAAFLASEPAARAQAWADEVAVAAPDVVGVQEALLVQTEAGVTVDFVTMLVDALATRGLAYEAVATVTNFAPLASLGPPFSFDVHVTDRDVTLVRADPHLAVTHAAAGTYATTLPTSYGPVLRGWTSVELSVEGRPVRVVNTHLEALDEDTRKAQAVELVRLHAGGDVPTILLGDFNSGPPAPTPTYDLLTRGFTDVWARVGSGPGLTCCHDDLTPAVPFAVRIDLVLAGDGVEPVAAALVGDAPGSTFPFFPSDHAGVVATLELL